VALRDEAKVPVLMNQWSVVRGVTEKAGRYAYVSDLADLLQEFDIGWAWWTFRGNEPKPGSSAFVYYANNGSIIQEDGLISAVKGFMADTDKEQEIAVKLP
jgi:hypothetical protein